MSTIADLIKKKELKEMPITIMDEAIQIMAYVDQLVSFSQNTTEAGIIRDFRDDLFTEEFMLLNQAKITELALQVFGKNNVVRSYVSRLTSYWLCYLEQADRKLPVINKQLAFACGTDNTSSVRLTPVAVADRCADTENMEQVLNGNKWLTALLVLKLAYPAFYEQVTNQ